MFGRCCADLVGQHHREVDQAPSLEEMGEPVHLGLALALVLYPRAFAHDAGGAVGAAVGVDGVVA